MKRICNQCKIEMIEGCSVNVECSLYGIKIKKKGTGVLNGVSAKPKAAVCPNCGEVVFYIDDYKDFVE